MILSPTLALLAAAPTVALAPVKVFLLAGQSNMQGHGFYAADPKRNGGKGSLESAVKDPSKRKIFGSLMDRNGKWKVRDDVWIHYFERRAPLTVGFGVGPDCIGPEFGFGNVVGDYLKEPVLLVKIAWGGKSLAVDFRPPSAGGTTGPFYNQMITEAREALTTIGTRFPNLAGRPVELVGFGWHQGWNDRINEGFVNEYQSNMGHFIRDVRRDLGTPNMPFVIAETGMGGLQEQNKRALKLMDAQAAVANEDEFKGNVAFVGTRSFWRTKEESPSAQDYHWNSNGETYYLIGDSMGRAMIDLLKRGHK